MLAKLVAWGPDRQSAIGRMLRALETFPVLGVTTNISFLLRALAHPEFVSGDYDTGFIAKHPDLTATPDSGQLQAAAVEIAEGFWQANGSNTARRETGAVQDTQGPWQGLSKSVFP